MADQPMETTLPKPVEEIVADGGFKVEREEDGKGIIISLPVLPNGKEQKICLTVSPKGIIDGDLFLGGNSGGKGCERALEWLIQQAFLEGVNYGRPKK